VTVEQMSQVMSKIVNEPGKDVNIVGQCSYEVASADVNVDEFCVKAERDGR
jgi:hypothetical protein